MNINYRLNFQIMVTVLLESLKNLAEECDICIIDKFCNNRGTGSVQNGARIPRTLNTIST